MGQAGTIIAFIWTIIALGLHIAVNFLEWLPNNQALHDLLTASLNIKLLTSTMPIVGAILCGIATIILIIDFHAKKAGLKVLGMLVLLGAAGALGYAIGLYLYKMVMFAIDVLGYDWNLDGTPTAQDIQDANNQLAAWLGISGDTVSDIMTNLNITSFDQILGEITDVIGLGLLGSICAAVAVVMDIWSVLFYSFVLCCCNNTKDD